MKDDGYEGVAKGDYDEEEGGSYGCVESNYQERCERYSIYSTIILPHLV